MFDLTNEFLLFIIKNNVRYVWEITMSKDFSSTVAHAHSEFRRGLNDVTPYLLVLLFMALLSAFWPPAKVMAALTTGIMGALVFAGSSQIVALERIASDTGALIAVVAGLALNLRILLMTASLHNEFRGRPLWQVLLGIHPDLR